MALEINIFILTTLVCFGNIFIGISGSDEANEGLKAEQFESRRSYPRMGAEKGEINPALIPEECINMGICEKIPVGLEFSDVINSIDKSEKDKYLVDEHQVDHEHRVGDDSLALCEAISKSITPFVAQANDGLWYRILNSENENIQTYNGVVCRSDGENCRVIDNVLAYNLKEQPFCKQNYVWRKMAYIGKNDEIKHNKKFKVPISCTCKKKLKKKPPCC